MSFYWVEESCQIQSLPEIYSRFLGNKKDGVFVEIGAYDGRTYSNTWCLAELGWKGLYVEPVDALYERCVGNHKDHPNITVLKAWVGDGSKVCAFVSENLNSISPLYLIHHPELTPIGMFTTITLNEIVEVYEMPDIDVLVIDVEGAEKDVLTGFDLVKHLPTMVIIEAHEGHEEKWMSSNVAFIREYFSKLYTKVYSDKINNVYVHNEFAWVMKEFA